MKSCWQNCLEDGQITKSWLAGFQDFFIILTDTISLDGSFHLWKKVAYCPSMTWLVMTFFWPSYCICLIFILRSSLLSLPVLFLLLHGLTFLFQVYGEMNKQIVDAVSSMVYLFMFYFNMYSLWKHMHSIYLLGVYRAVFIVSFKSSISFLSDKVCSLTKWYPYLHMIFDLKIE